MLTEPRYESASFSPSEEKHRYGDKVHIAADPYLATLLARVCVEDCRYPELAHLVGTLYRHLLASVIAAEFPTVPTEVTTRMAALHPEQGSFRARLVDKKTRVVCVALARAGIVPSQVCFEMLSQLIEPQRIRQDHIAIQRKLNAKETVVGADVGGVKIGGDVEDSVVLLPDPMGATGSSIAQTLELYQERGKPKTIVALHLVVTPEYLAFVTKKFPEVRIYALRLDRGLSPTAVLGTMPGERWREERGLNDKQYIVPGAGGLGEVLNNSFV